ncbi:MAG: IS1595 family transposase [Phycisphaerales bacterium]|nr:MAG: IS1595 family transposase [Phycisphaerales bacterium]
MNFNKACQLSEDEAREYLEGLRWPNGPICPHCGSEDSAKLNGKATRPGVHKCKNRECRRQFTVTVGTIFERSHIPLSKWIMAFCLVCSSKKGMSAHQLYRMLGLGSYKSAWHLAHRIRHAMKSEPLRGMLSGTVEADETYVGGKPREHGPHNKKFRGHGTKKTPVVALIQRDGPMRTRVVRKVNAKTLRKAVDDMVDKTSSRLMTDDLMAYRTIGRTFAGGHKRVRHNMKEYVRGDAHCNTCESYFALLKRGVHATFHHVGKQHLQRYCDEFAFRWNHRKVSDGERTEAALKLAPGARLAYRTPRS